MGKKQCGMFQVKPKYKCSLFRIQLVIIEIRCEILWQTASTTTTPIASTTASNPPSSNLKK